MKLNEIITYFKTLALNFQFPVTLPAITLPCKLKTLKTRVRKAIIEVS